MNKKPWEKLLPYLRKMDDYNHLASILNYDIATNTPEKGIEDESNLLNMVSGWLADIMVDPNYVEAVRECAKDDSLNEMQKSLIKKHLIEIEVFEKMPREEFDELNTLKSKSNEMWRKFKPLDDFASWLPYWEKLVFAYRKSLKYRQKEGQTLYEASLSQYEPGESEASIERVFNPLKEFLLKKIPEVVEKEKSISYRPLKPYSEDAQRHLSFTLLKLIGYKLDQGCVRESMHPFSDYTGRYDSRVTTDYVVSDWRSNAFSIIHEGGHCIQFQNWSDEMFENHVNASATTANYETHSRFYENIIGRSMSFVPSFKAACAKELDPEFASWSDQEFFDLINQVKPIANRCDSDELTYSLHIIIRYEIERDLINGKIEPKDVPAIWRKKYIDYLGVDEATDKEGCMQDVHWTDASFGYFPSYALGNVYGAQILAAMKKDLDFEKLVRDGNLVPIREWFKKKDFCNDWMEPKDWVKKVTGEELNLSHYIDYLNEKF